MLFFRPVVFYGVSETSLDMGDYEWLILVPSHTWSHMWLELDLLLLSRIRSSPFFTHAHTCDYRRRLFSPLILNVNNCLGVKTRNSLRQLGIYFATKHITKRYHIKTTAVPTVPTVPEYSCRLDVISWYGNQTFDDVLRYGYIVCLVQLCSPCDIVAAGDKYNASQYGSNLWDLRSKSAEIVHASWQTNIKLAWKLPQQTENCFINKPFCHGCHNTKNSENCKVHTVAWFASRDFRSNLGLNLKYMRKETGLNPWSYVTERIKRSLIKHNLSVVSPSDVWRIILEKNW